MEFDKSRVYKGKKDNKSKKKLRWLDVFMSKWFIKNEPNAYIFWESMELVYKPIGIECEEVINEIRSKKK